MHWHCPDAGYSRVYRLTPPAVAFRVLFQLQGSARAGGTGVACLAPSLLDGGVHSGSAAWGLSFRKSLGHWTGAPVLSTYLGHLHAKR